MPQAPAIVKRLANFVDTHPRTGWYVAGIVTIDILMDVLHVLL